LFIHQRLVTLDRFAPFGHPALLISLDDGNHAGLPERSKLRAGQMIARACWTREWLNRRLHEAFPRMPAPLSPLLGGVAEKAISGLFQSASRFLMLPIDICAFA
jgi:hypothetical protein